MSLDQPNNEYEKHLQKAKIKAIPSHVKRVLEIGCGDGSVFKDTQMNCDGYDVSQEAILACRKVKNYRKISDRLADFRVDDYDCICLLGVMEHMGDDEISKVLNYIKGAKGVYVTVPNAESFHRKLGLELKYIRTLTDLSPADLAIGHKRYYTINSLTLRLKDFIAKNRYKIIKQGTLGFKYDTSQRMANQLQKAEALDKVALDTGVIGLNRFNGAELFMYLSR